MKEEEKIIKTSIELALQKVNDRNIDYAEIENFELFEEGKKIAGLFLKDKKFNINEALKSYSEDKRKPVIEGIEQIFLLNLILPKRNSDYLENTRVLEGIVLIKKDKQTISGVCGAIEEMFKSYRITKEEIYRQFRSNFKRHFEQRKEEIESQTGQKIDIDFEQHPEFHRQLQEYYNKLDSEYYKGLNEYKKQIKIIS